MTIQEIRNKVERQKGKRNQIMKSLVIEQDTLRFKKRDLKYHEQAKEIIRTVGLKTQEQLQFHISDLTSLALESVFPDPYELKVEFIQRRNKTECDLYFMREEHRVDPLEASGVGAVDVATFALRIASWSMALPKSRNTIILDEPFRHLSTDFQERASLMLQEISKKLGVQFIIVTHEDELTAAADRVFRVRKNKKTGRSKVTQL